MTTPELLAMIRRACEGTPAEGLAPSVVPGAVPLCASPCPHGTRDWCYASGCQPPGLVCIPAVEALARLAVEGAAEVERLTEALRVATARTSAAPSWGEVFAGVAEPGPPGVATARTSSAQGGGSR